MTTAIGAPPVAPGGDAYGGRASHRARVARDRVTGAGAPPGGRTLGVRTCRTLALRERAALLGRGVPALTVSRGAVGASQGEGAALAADGRVLVTSEGDPARFPVLRCPVR